VAGIYKYGFEDGTPIADAKARALELLRAPVEDGGAADADEVTFGPDVVQGDAQQAAGTFLVRVVTGHAEDPAVVAARKRARVAHVPPADAVVGRLAALPADKLARLAALLDKVEGR
jgi:hypothetical protein